MAKKKRVTMTVKLPDRCPICGSDYHFGNDNMKIAFVDEDGIKHYSLPIRYYFCGAKMWLSEERELSYKLILQKCVEPKEEK